MIVLLIKYYSGEQIEYKMGGVCSTYGTYERFIECFGGNLRERDHWEIPGVDVKIILRWIFRKWNVAYGLDLSDSGQGQVADTSECGNEA